MRWRLTSCAAVIACIAGACAGDTKDSADDTDVVETDVVDTDTVAPDTDVADTDPPDTDLPETDLPETDLPDTDVDTDTALPQPDPVSFEAVPGPFLTPGNIEPGTWWITTADQYTALLGEPAPAALAAGTHAAIAWYGGDRAWLSARPEITGLVSYAPGSLTMQVVTHDLDAACDRFTSYLPQIAVALTPTPVVPVRGVSTTTQADTTTCDPGRIEGQTCSLAEPCAAGLLCAAVTMVDEGLCVERTQLGVFTATGAGPIPDADPSGVTLTFDVSGLATVPLDVVLELNLNHPRPDDLDITLTAPSTSSAQVRGHEARAGGRVRLRTALGFPADESITGAWQLQVVDRAGGEVGSVSDATLEILSQWD